MKISTKRLSDSEELIEVKKLTIYIGEDRYRIIESIDGKMTINKMSDGLSDIININPRYANEIDIF